MATKLEKKVIYTGSIKLKTGLHIGDSNVALNIGGLDKFVVRNPLNKLPYIPGSSLKGKMRALVEIANGETNNGKPTSNPAHKAAKLFGISSDVSDSHPSRLIVRDAELWIDDPELKEKFLNTDLLYTESKTEAFINRITAEAKPRTFERVPAGAKFKLNMVLNVFEGEDEQSLKATLMQAIKLLEDDYLGGHGSRGYGQVEIKLDNDKGVDRTY